MLDNFETSNAFEAENKVPQSILKDRSTTTSPEVQRKKYAKVTFPEKLEDLNQKKEFDKDEATCTISGKTPKDLIAEAKAKVNIKKSMEADSEMNQYKSNVVKALGTKEYLQDLDKTIAKSLSDNPSMEVEILDRAHNMLQVTLDDLLEGKGDVSAFTPMHVGKVILDKADSKNVSNNVKVRLLDEMKKFYGKKLLTEYIIENDLLGNVKFNDLDHVTETLDALTSETAISAISKGIYQITDLVKIDPEFIKLITSENTYMAVSFDRSIAQDLLTYANEGNAEALEAISSTKGLEYLSYGVPAFIPTSDHVEISDTIAGNIIGENYVSNSENTGYYALDSSGTPLHW